MARGHYLARDLKAPVQHPAFDQTAMDGYAFRHADLAEGTPLRLVGEIRAGDPADRQVKAGECLRIFTGAPVPASVDTVVMQEYTRREGDLVHIEDPGLKLGANIRKAGEQLEKGDIALTAGTRLSASAVGLIASLGVKEAYVRPGLRYGLLVTGSEFAERPEQLAEGKIFESNGPMLQAALAREGIDCGYAVVQDDAEYMRTRVEQFAGQCDVLLMTGGVSVGEYDFTRAALEANGFEVVFHKVRQKPGKPILFCRRRNQVAFGLPGNPRSVMVSFYQYVLPHLHASMGAENLGLPTLALPLAHDHRKKDDGKTWFVTGSLENGRINLLKKQGSHMLQSMAAADVLVQLPGDQTEYAAGDLLNARILPR